MRLSENYSVIYSFVRSQKHIIRDRYIPPQLIFRSRRLPKLIANEHNQITLSLEMDPINKCRRGIEFAPKIRPVRYGAHAHTQIHFLLRHSQEANQ